MSDQTKVPATPTPERTYDDVRTQYTQLCNKAGHLSYQLDTTTKDLQIIYNQLRDLNFEAAAIQAKQKAKEAQAALDKAQADLKKEALESTSPVDPTPELPATKKPRKLKEVKADA